MKLEIEITEDEIKSDLERRVRVAIADQNNSWSTESTIKDRVKEAWSDALDAQIVEILGNSTVLKEKIAAEVERRVKARVAAILKSA